MRNSFHNLKSMQIDWSFVKDCAITIGVFLVCMTAIFLLTVAGFGFFPIL